MSFSGSFVHLDGVRTLLPFRHTTITSYNTVPFIMVAWGTIMSLMCLVNSYHGLVMYTIRFTHLTFTHFE